MMVAREKYAVLVSRLFLLSVGLLVTTVLALQLQLTIKANSQREIIQETADIIKKQQDEAAADREILMVTAEAIQSCTTPEGACYQREQEQAGTAVATINEITLYAVTCADNVGTNSYEEILACVEAEITRP